MEARTSLHLFPGIRGCSEEGVRGQEWSEARIRAIFHLGR